MMIALYVLGALAGVCVVAMLFNVIINGKD